MLRKLNYENIIINLGIKTVLEIHNRVKDYLKNSINFSNIALLRAEDRCLIQVILI